MGRQMDLAAPGFGDDSLHIPGGDPRPWQDLDAPRPIADHLPNGASPQRYIRFLAAGEDPRDSQGNKLIQRLSPVGDHVDGPVEDAFFSRRLGQPGQYFCPLPVQAPILVQKAKHQPVRPVGQQELCILHRGGKLRLGIAEAPFPGPHHRHNLHAGFPLGNNQLPQGGGQPAVEQVAI